MAGIKNADNLDRIWGLGEPGEYERWIRVREEDGSLGADVLVADPKTAERLVRDHNALLAPSVGARGIATHYLTGACTQGADCRHHVCHYKDCALPQALHLPRDGYALPLVEAMRRKKEYDAALKLAQGKGKMGRYTDLRIERRCKEHLKVEAASSFRVGKPGLWGRLQAVWGLLRKPVAIVDTEICLGPDMAPIHAYQRVDNLGVRDYEEVMSR